MATTVDFVHAYTAVNNSGLFTTSDNLFELVSEKKGEQTEFSLRKYL